MIFVKNYLIILANSFTIEGIKVSICPSVLMPEAFLCPPPPNFEATTETSTLSKERKPPVQVDGVSCLRKTTASTSFEERSN